MTRLTVAEVDERIEGFRSVLDRTTERLVALDADVTRQLLEASTSLKSLTAASWSDASRRYADLWAGQIALAGLLARVMEVRGQRRSVPQAVLEQLDQLLVGACVDLPRSPAGVRPSLTGPVAAAQLSIDDTLRAMSDDYEIVADLVAAVAEVWERASERLLELARDLSGLEARAVAGGVGLRNEFRATEEAVARATAIARSDPLELAPDETSDLGARVRRLAAAVDQAVKDVEIRGEILAGALRSVQGSLEVVATCRAQLDVWAEKIVVPDETWVTLERLERDLQEVSHECDRLGQLGTDVGADRLARRVASLDQEVRAVGAAEARRFDTRDELRGVLDAYHAKALATGLAEDLPLDRLYTLARDELYGAPCDVAEADRLVAEYRQALRPSSEGPQ